MRGEAAPPRAGGARVARSLARPPASTALPFHLPPTHPCHPPPTAQASYPIVILPLQDKSTRDGAIAAGGFSRGGMWKAVDAQPTKPTSDQQQQQQQQR